MTSKTTPTDLETATRAAEEADARVNAIRTAIRTGSTKIKPGDLESAEADARLAHLRIESIEAATTSQTEHDRLEAINTVRAEIEAEIEDPAPVHRSPPCVEDASVAWIQLNDARATQMRGWRKRSPRPRRPNEVRRGHHSTRRIRHRTAALELCRPRHPHRHRTHRSGRRWRVPDRAHFPSAQQPSSTPNAGQEDLYARLTRELGYVPTKN